MNGGCVEDPSGCFAVRRRKQDAGLLLTDGCQIEIDTAPHGGFSQ